MMEELLNKDFKYTRVCQSLENSRHQDIILAIDLENLMPLSALETGNLDRCHSARGPAGPPEASPFITAWFVYEDQVIRAEIEI